MKSAVVRHVLALVATIIVGGFVAATMVRFAPAFDVDESRMDSRLSNETREALGAERLSQRDVVGFYARYTRAAVHGDFGKSFLFDRPVSELIKERYPTTLKIAGVGLGLGWTIAFLLAAITSLVRRRVGLVSTLIAGTFLSIPSAVIAVFFAVANKPAAFAIALVVFPRLYGYLHGLFESCYEMPHVLNAKARGLSDMRVLLSHVLPVVGRQVIALAGVSVSVAIGAAIPVEALIGIPGLGQLAWQSAAGRDLPLLVTVTILVTAVTLIVNSTSDLLGEAFDLSKA